VEAEYKKKGKREATENEKARVGEGERKITGKWKPQYYYIIGAANFKIFGSHLSVTARNRRVTTSIS
jgi:hypothetical protein